VIDQPAVLHWMIRYARGKSAGFAVPPEPASFADFKKKYLDTYGISAMEDNSLGAVRMHLSHFERTLGSKFPLQQLTSLFPALSRDQSRSSDSLEPLRHL